MARTGACGFGAQSATIDGSGVGGALSYDTALTRTGLASLKIVAASGSNGSAGSLALGGGTGWYRVYMRPTTLPGTARSLLGSHAGAFGLRWNADGTISYFDGTATLKGTSSTALTDTTKWYRVEFRCAAGTTVPLLVIDGVTQVTATIAASSWGGNMGPNDTVAAVYTINFADIAADGAAFPGAGAVAFLPPTGDNSVGGSWTNSAGTGTSLFDCLDNTPPVGVADTTGNAGKLIRNAGANTSYVATMQTYTAAGVSGTVNSVQSYVIVAAPSVTGAKTGSQQLTANPAAGSATAFAGGASAATNYWRGSAGGVYPTGWGIERAAIITSPTVTLGTAPTLSLNITGGTTSRIADCCAMGMYVDYTPATAATLTLAAVSGVATTTATIQKLKGLSNGPASGVGTATVSLNVKRALAVAPAGVATATPTLNAKWKVTTAAAGLATAVASRGRLKPATAGSVAGAGTAAASIGRLRGASVSPIGGVGTTTVTRGATRLIPALLAAGLALTTVTATATRAGAATPTGTSTASASLSVKRAVTASASGIASTTAGVHAKYRITTAPSGTGATTVTLSVKRRVTASAAGIATPSVSLSANRKVTTSAAGLSTATVSLAATRNVTAAASGVSTATVARVAKRALSVAPAGTGTATGTVVAKRGVTVAPAGTGTTSVSLTAKRRITTAAAGQATTTATIARLGNTARTATASGTSTATVTAGRIRPVSASASGTSTSTAALHARRLASAVADGTGTATVSVQALRGRSVTASGAGSVTVAPTVISATTTFRATVGDRTPDVTARDRTPAVTASEGTPACAIRDRTPAVTIRDLSPAVVSQDETPSVTATTPT